MTAFVNEIPVNHIDNGDASSPASHMVLETEFDPISEFADICYTMHSMIWNCASGDLDIIVVSARVAAFFPVDGSRILTSYNYSFERVLSKLYVDPSQVYRHSLLKQYHAWINSPISFSTRLVSHCCRPLPQSIRNCWLSHFERRRHYKHIVDKYFRL